MDTKISNPSQNLSHQIDTEIQISNHQMFLEKLRQILDPQDLHLNNAVTKAVGTNTLAVNHAPLAVGFPRTLEQVQQIVMAANNFQVAVYPVSQGKNIGYGDMTAAGENQFVLCLKYLNCIREYDMLNGEIVVEPGVTQQQLSDFLREKKSPFIADMTGASPEASIVGNFLEGGFGYTPIGDHRKHILGVEAILADGSVINTAEGSSMGPELSQLFVQSNFGVVTAMRIPLLAIPEVTTCFTLSFSSDEKYFQGVEILRNLRKLGVIDSLVHCGNATRALMTSSTFPTEVSPDTVLSSEDCRQILSKRTKIQFGAWTAVGGLYGFRAEVKEKSKMIRKNFKGIAQVSFYSNKKINLLDQLLNTPVIRNFKFVKEIRASFNSLLAIPRIMNGIPSDVPSKNIYWRVQEKQNLGLIWHSPVMPATAADAKVLLETTQAVFSKYGFEMPVTMTLLDHKKMMVILNLNFDRSSPSDVERAHLAYKELVRSTNLIGYQPYRIGILSDTSEIYRAPKAQFLNSLKQALDSRNTIAPGRYGIRS